MTKTQVAIVATLLLATMSFAAIAGMPSDYAAVKYDDALENAKRDGRLVMVYFGEDW